MLKLVRQRVGLGSGRRAQSESLGDYIPVRVRLFLLVLAFRDGAVPCEQRE